MILDIKKGNAEPCISLDLYFCTRRRSQIAKVLFLRQMIILLLSEKQQQHIFFIGNSSFPCDVIIILRIAVNVQFKIVIIGYSSE